MNYFATYTLNTLLSFSSIISFLTLIAKNTENVPASLWKYNYYYNYWLSTEKFDICVSINALVFFKKKFLMNFVNKKCSKNYRFNLPTPASRYKVLTTVTCWVRFTYSHTEIRCCQRLHVESDLPAPASR